MTAGSPRNRLARRLRHWIRRARLGGRSARGARRGPVTLVVILDGTMSSLEPGQETNAGQIWKLLSTRAPSASLAVYYEPGIQFTNWRQLRDVIEGRGLNRQIRRAYGWLASRYRPGDRIFLFGYSRGAYAVRSLAGVIDRVGLLTAAAATERNVAQAYRHYRTISESAAAERFRAVNCHPSVVIDMIGVFDTVKALGLRAPLVWRWTEVAHRFHDHALGRSTRRGYHALALHERREAYAPVMWRTDPNWTGLCEQRWFRGTHGDVGGQLAGETRSRPLANIPLVWMLERAEATGLRLPDGWREAFPCDPQAPSIGLDRGWGRALRARMMRPVGRDPSERVDDSALAGPEPPPFADAFHPAVRRAGQT